MALTRDELLSQALLGLAVIERVLVPERGELADELLAEIKENDTKFEDLKALYRQLLYAATMLTAHGADEADQNPGDFLAEVRGSMLAARLRALDED